MNLNEDQLKAVNFKKGKAIWLAGPGAGKTSTIIEYFKSLVSEGVRPDEILCLTFTASAAETMSKRASTSKDSFRTFHSFCYYILTIERGKQPLEPDLRHRLLSKLCKKWGVDYKELANFISRMRHKKILPEEAQEDSYAYGRAYGEYERERQLAGWIDFDSMICDAALLLENPEVRKRWQKKFVIVDEAQDTDELQHWIAEAISEDHGNLVLVGDAGQSIYGFRDAVPERLLDSSRPTFCLGVNYRSTHNIVNYVKKHSPYKTPLVEAMRPATTEKGTLIEYRMFPTDRDEAEATIASAQLDPLNSAILARTNRLLAPFENLLLEYRIKYSLLGSSGYWKQSEIKKVVEMLGQYKHVPTEAATRLVVGDVSRFYQVDDATREDNEALQNLKTLVDISKRFRSVSELITFANRAAHAKKQKGVTIGTCHASKGMEFNNVYLVGCREGMMPHIKGDFEEEKRIFYVAISRAAKKLRISFTGSPSSFIRDELDETILLTIKQNYDKIERILKQGELYS